MLGGLSAAHPYLQIQFQVVFLDPVGLAQNLAEDPTENCRKNKADQEQSDPVHGSDAAFYAGGDVIDPAGVDTNLTDEAAGAHAGGQTAGRCVHFQFE